MLGTILAITMPLFFMGCMACIASGTNPLKVFPFLYYGVTDLWRRALGKDYRLIPLPAAPDGCVWSVDTTYSGGVEVKLNHSQRGWGYLYRKESPGHIKDARRETVRLMNVILKKHAASEARSAKSNRVHNQIMAMRKELDA